MYPNKPSDVHTIKELEPVIFGLSKASSGAVPCFEQIGFFIIASNRTEKITIWTLDGVEAHGEPPMGSFGPNAGFGSYSERTR